MTKILLISEDYIKTNSGLNDNVWGNYLTPAIREAQDIKLQQILGTSLYESLLEKVKNGAIRNEKFRQYKNLLDDFVQPYLMYQTISDLVPIIGVKLTNLGVVVSNDEHLTNLTQGERELVQTYYGQRAEFYGKRLQGFLKDNHSDFEELGECNHNQLDPTLNTIADTGIWLGGYRGRKLL